MVSRWIFLFLLIANGRAVAQECPVVEALPACADPANCFVDIKDNSNPDPGNFQLDPRARLMAGVARAGTTVRLGPDVDLDFSSLPDCLFPIRFGRGVTLTSVASFDAGGSLPRTGLHGMPGALASRDQSATQSGSSRETPAGDAATTPVGTSDLRGDEALGGVGEDLEVAEYPGIPQARSPQSLGPRLRYGPHRNDVKIFFEIPCAPEYLNDNVRISGFRIHGPSFGPQETDDYGIKIIRCTGIEISNMEIAGWGGAAIMIQDDRNKDTGFGDRILGPDEIRIYNNFLHHNQHPTNCGIGGYIGDFLGISEPCHANGYGVNVGHSGWAHISGNVFDSNRHAIAAPGDTGGYLAERNLVLKGGGYHGGLSFGPWSGKYTHQFDVHGTGCAWSSNLCGDAGTQIWISLNSFQYHNGNAIKLRGRPLIGAYISNNVFPHGDLDDAIHLNTDDNVEIDEDNNEVDVDSFGKYGVCDFDGDGIDDLFLATGRTWWYSSYGELHWSYMNTKPERFEQLRFGYFDSDLRCDVLAEIDGQWMIVSGGYGNWQPLGSFGVPLSEARFGRFGPGGFGPGGSPCGVTDHRRRPGSGTLRTTHAFRRDADGQWRVTPLSDPDGWTPVANSSLPLEKLGFGDFNGDGATDVIAVVNGHWAISESAACRWRRINPHLGYDVAELQFANMDADDSIDDILWLERKYTHTGSNTSGVTITGSKTSQATLTWWRSKNGTQPWEEYATHTFTFVPTRESVTSYYGFAGRFGIAPGGGTLVIDPDRVGNFYSSAEELVNQSKTWKSQFPY